MKVWTALCALGLLAGLLVSTHPSTGATTACGASFTLVPSTPVGKLYSNFEAVDAKSKSLAWGAGFWRPAPDVNRPLFERWNGSKWVAVKGKNVTPGDNVFSGVAIVSPKLVWAVGSAALGGSGARTLVERWTPKGVQVVPSPSPGDYAELVDVRAFSAKSAFAVGFWSKSGVLHGLAERWNGKKWTTMPAKIPDGSTFGGIDALSPKNAWAVGSVRQNGVDRTLIEHWDGKVWVVVPSPNRGDASTENRLTDIDVISAKDAWAVGWIGGAGNRRSNLTLHWNGTAWSIVSIPQPGTHQNALYAVSAVGAKQVWTVGNFTDPDTNYKTMAFRWDGSSWKLVTTPNPASATAYNVLVDAAALKSGQVWAVGDYESTGSRYVPLVVRRCD